MAGGAPNSSVGLFPKLLITSALGYGLNATWASVRLELIGADMTSTVWAIGAALFVAVFAAVLADLAAVFRRLARLIRALRPPRRDASARWLTKREARKAGLGNTNGVFLGILNSLPLFISNGVHGLCLAPARTGKSTTLMMGALLHDIGMSRIVTCLKADLTYMAKSQIEEDQGDRVIIVNPANMHDMGNASYNPMIILLDDLESTPEDTMADAWSMAIQLSPPAPGGDRDPFWPNGTRKMIVFVTVALCALRESHEANLPRAFEIISDNDAFERLLIEASDSEVLAGELSKLAHNIASTWDENPKHFESFKEGAVQALVSFGPSGRLAPSMTHCDFRFADLKRERTTLFLVCDYSRMDVFAPWLGLLVWASLKELVRSGNGTPVQYLLDEFTNYVLPGLPKALTALGGYGVRVWMIVQELEEIRRAYGPEALATILSQTDVKQFFGVSSHETARLVSQMLGDEDVVSESFGLGANPWDMPNLNMSRARQPLLTPDQVRRLPADEQLIFIKNLPPARALKVGYHQVDPWRNEARPNPLHDYKPFLGTVMMRLRRGKAKATWVGTRKFDQTRHPVIKPVLGTVISSVPLVPVLLVAGSVTLVLSFGWPHLLWEYTASGSMCRYLGVPLVSDGFVTSGDGPCSLIRFAK